MQEIRESRKHERMKGEKKLFFDLSLFRVFVFLFFSSGFGFRASNFFFGRPLAAPGKIK